MDIKEEYDKLKKENEELIKWKERVTELFWKTCSCKYLDFNIEYCAYYDGECIAINQCLYRAQDKLERIEKLCDDIVIIDDADCELPIEIRKVINE